jgi:mannose-6-phosphate isomerase-like protein (cupin superfamily)
MKPLIVIAAALPLLAAGPPGFVHWKGADLKAYGGKLAPRMTESKSAGEQFGKQGHAGFAIACREASGEAEIHDGVADMFVVQAGEATLVVGGKVVAPRTVSPGEIRGKSIEGGVSKQLVAGDIVHIPPATPHQLLVSAKAKPFTYFVIKVDK